MSSFGAFGGGPTFTNFGNTGSTQQPGFGDYADLFQGLPGMNQPPPGYTYNPATGMNQTRVGGTAQNPLGGVVYQQAPDQSFGFGGFGQFQGGALQDYMNLMNATMQNYQNTMGAVGNLQQSVMGGAEDIRQGGQTAFDQMTGFGSQVSQMGQGVAEGIRGAADTAVDQFKDLSAQQASAISSGLMAQNRTQRQNLDAQAKLGDPNAMAALQQFELDSDMKTAQVMTQQASDYNNALANLNMQRAGMYGQAGQLQLGFEQQAQALNQAGVSMQQSAIAQAANFEAQGLSGVAQMVAANPYNPVAFLPTLMAYFQFGMTEGSGSFPGFSSEFLGAMA